MTTDNSQLQKQLFPIDLSKGMDEQTRPEVLPAGTGLTNVMNLVQDQTGAWVKRDGLTLMNGIQLAGSQPYAFNTTKVIRLIRGLGVVSDLGLFSRYSDIVSSFVSVGKHIDFSASGAFMSAQAGVSGGVPTIKAFASCSTHDAVLVTTSAFGSSAKRDLVTIRERATGAEKTYDLGLVAFPGVTSGSGGSGAITFLGDSTLHVYTTPPGQTHLFITSIPVNVALPYDETLLSPKLVLASASISVTDAQGSYTIGGSFVLFNNVVGGFMYLMDTAGTTVVASGTFAFGQIPTSFDVDEVRGYVWLLEPANGAVRAVNWVSFATVVVARFVPANGVGDYVVCEVSSGDVYFMTSTTVGAGITNIKTTILRKLANGAGNTTTVGAAYGWNAVSRPFVNSITKKVYAHLSKQVLPGTGLGPTSGHVIACLSDFSPHFSNSAGLAIPFGRFRIACILEPYFGFELQQSLVGPTLEATPLRYNQPNVFAAALNDINYACVAYRSSSSVVAVATVKLYPADVRAYGTANFAGSSHFAHGGINSFDGQLLSECGFIDVPLSGIATVAGGLTGSYKYYVVYKYVDANGSVSYSRAYGPLSAVNAANTNLITVQPPGITQRSSSNANASAFVEIYRTTNGGTQLYLVASEADNLLGINATTGMITFTDTVSDAALRLNAVMYRQPGTPNAAADRYTSPATSVLCQHKDRLFCTDPYGQRVYYSSFFVDGESPWFSPLFSFFVHDGNGPITAMASMDGRLFIFKSNAIFVVDGDGPGESGPTGTEYSPPQKLASPYGCIDHRSVVVTTDGIVFQSVRGLEMISRNLKVGASEFSARMQNTIGVYPICTGACIDNDGLLRFLMASKEGRSTEFAPSGGGMGVELIYDTTNDAWSYNVYSGGISAAVPGRAMQTLCLATVNGKEKLVIAAPDNGVFVANPLASNDLFNVFNPFVIETAWMKASGLQGRQLFGRIMFLAKRRADSNHAVKISLAYDYSDTYTQSFTWQPGTINALPIEELMINPIRPQCLSIRMKIEEVVPDDTVTYPVGNGAACEIIGISAEITQLPGAPKVSDGQKG